MLRAGWLAVPALDRSHGAHLHQAAASHCCTDYTISRSTTALCCQNVSTWTAELGSRPFRVKSTRPMPKFSTRTVNEALNKQVISLMSAFGRACQVKGRYPRHDSVPISRALAVITRKPRASSAEYQARGSVIVERHERKDLDAVPPERPNRGLSGLKSSQVHCQTVSMPACPSRLVCGALTRV